MAKGKLSEYNEDSIKVQDFPYCVQEHPGMYLLSDGIEGNTHSINEIIDNSVDEAMNGYGDTIEITISNEDGYCEVRDFGRGIPLGAIEKALTTLHASGKFDNLSYKTSGGLHGVNIN